MPFRRAVLTAWAAVVAAQMGIGAWYWSYASVAHCPTAPGIIACDPLEIRPLWLVSYILFFGGSLTAILAVALGATRVVTGWLSRTPAPGAHLST